jgi:hypothetical protein
MCRTEPGEHLGCTQSLCLSQAVKQASGKEGEGRPAVPGAGGRVIGLGSAPEAELSRGQHTGRPAREQAGGWTGG